MDVLLSLGFSDQNARKTISEVYSPPRVSLAATSHPSSGIQAGFALDLTTVDEFGNPWNFVLPSQRI
eukprot:14277097-Heterocapsa_arctica.AAC.1